MLQPVVLTERDPRAPTPKHFRGELLPTQQALLYQMTQLEREGGKELAPGHHLRTNAATISSPVGSGKTALMVALALGPDPPQRPPKVNMLTLPTTKHTNPTYATGLHTEPDRRLCADAARHRRRGPPNIHTEVYSLGDCEWHPRRYIPATLVAASLSVLTQWRASIQRFAPHLRVMVLDGSRAHREFQRLLHAGRTAELHIVLARTGDIAINGVRQSHLAALARHTWARLVLDDYDSANIVGRDSLPPAFFTWYVSATRRYTNFTARADKLSGMLPGGWPALAATLDSTLYGLLSITLSEEFQQASFPLPPPVYRNAIFRAPRMLRLLRGADLPAEVWEMLSSGALDSAAQALNLDCRTPGDIMTRVLSRGGQGLARARRVLVALDQIRAHRGETAKPMSDTTLKALVRMAGAHPANIPSRLAETLTSYPPADPELYVQARTEAETTLRRAQGEVDRLLENLREEECQVCYATRGETGAQYVLACCQVVLCEQCIVDNREGKDGRFIGSCPSCQAILNPKTDLARIATDIDLENLEFTEPEEEDTPEGEQAPPPPPGDKYAAIIRLVQGHPLGAQREEPGEPIRGLMCTEGAAFPDPPAQPRRVLVFAVHAEAARRVARELRETADIQVQRLAGHRRDRDAAVRWYASPDPPPRVLVITASRDCAGLHLPQTTHLVLLHRIADPHTATQVVGRAQRPGRQAPLQVWRFLYDSGE